jgi:hypothetical protein
MSTTRAFWAKIGEKKQYDIRKDELTEALKLPLKDEKQRPTLTSDFQKAENLAKGGKYKDAMKALDKIQLDINASIEVRTDPEQIEALGRALDPQMETYLRAVGVIPPAIENRKKAFVAAIDKDDYVKAQSDLDDLKTATDDAVEQKMRYEARRQMNCKTINEISQKIRTKAYGDPPAGALGVAVDAFTKAGGEITTNDKASDFTKVSSAFDDLEASIKAINVAATTYASEQERFEGRKKSLESVIEELAGKVLAKAYGYRPSGTLDNAVKAYGKAQGEVVLQGQSGDYVKANTALDGLETPISQVQQADVAAAGALMKQCVALEAKHFDDIERVKAAAIKKKFDNISTDITTAWSEFDRLNGVYLNAINKMNRNGRRWPSTTPSTGACTCAFPGKIRACGTRATAARANTPSAAECTSKPTHQNDGATASRRAVQASASTSSGRPPNGLPRPTRPSILASSRTVIRCTAGSRSSSLPTRNNPIPPGRSGPCRSFEPLRFLVPRAGSRWRFPPTLA